MWKYLLIQGLLFFLFFQPGLVAARIGRIMLLMTAFFTAVMTYFFARMDPFAWLAYCIGIFLTYYMAQKALRWVAVNRQKMTRDSKRLENKAIRAVRVIREKNARVRSLQGEISRVSRLYDKVKEMSRSLEFLDVFVDFSEAVMDNFSISKSRLLLLARRSKRKKVIERAYQLDAKHSEFSTQDRNLVGRDVIFRGEVFPFDLRLIEAMEVNQKPWIYWDTREAEAALGCKLPVGLENLAAFPVTTEEGLGGLLILEGVRRHELDDIRILINRFMSEYHRIKLFADVQRLAITDWLTGVYVRRHFFRRLEEEIARAARFSLKFSFLMIDLDDFKACNDRYGHQVGDAVLRQTADLIKKTVREVDLVGRYGGEEFTALLLDADDNTTMNVAERIRKNVEKKRFRAYDLELRMTVSVGFATYHSGIREAGELVEWADSAMYQAKRQGKNRVCAYLGR